MSGDIVEFSWTVGSTSTIEKTETCCSLNASVITILTDMLIITIIYME